MVWKDEVGKTFSFVVTTYSLIGSNTPFLLGKKEMKEWKTMINLCEDKLEIEIKSNGKSEKRSFKMTEGNHSTIELQMDSPDEEVVNFIDVNWLNVADYKGVKKVHKVHGHKSEVNLIHAYKVANLLTPKLKSTIKRVVDDCKICQKFRKSVP